MESAVLEQCNVINCNCVVAGSTCYDLAKAKKARTEKSVAGSTALEQACSRTICLKGTSSVEMFDRDSERQLNQLR